MSNTDNNKSSPWSYIALSDRETLISGFIGWLMDPHGNHGLGAGFLKEILNKCGLSIKENIEKYSIAVEIKRGGSRFDLLVQYNENEEPVDQLILEVKCKTFGYAQQLKNYSKISNNVKVVRVSYGEFNFTDLNDNHKEHFPLITFYEIAALIDKAGKSIMFEGLIQSLKEHLIKESDAFSNLHAFYIEEKKFPHSPFNEYHYTLGDSFVNLNYWMNVSEQAKKNKDEEFENFSINNQRSGVWYAGGGRKAESGRNYIFKALGVNLIGPFEYWIHIELHKSLLGSPSGYAGRVQLRIKNDGSHEHRLKLFEMFRNASGQLQRQGYKIRSNKPSQSNYYYVCQKDLTREDFRYSNIKKLITEELLIEPV